MTAERLLALYDRVADAPDAIPRLRKFILNLAVRGKLVPQDRHDEPASELLRRLPKKEKGDQQPRGSRHAPRHSRSDDSTLPLGWTSTTLGSVTLTITDGTHRTPTYVQEGVPFVSVKDFSSGSLELSGARRISEAEHRALSKRCEPRRGDILIGRIGTLGRPVLVETDEAFSVFVSVGLIRFDAETLVPEFLKLALASPVIEREFNRIKVGGATHTNKLNLGDLYGVPFWLPPLAEQHRIVTKIDELMGVCDQLQAVNASREKMRDRLATTSFARLNAPVPDENTLGRDARFAVRHFTEVTTRPEQVKQLRQTILNLAVRGKLVPQDSAEGPSATLDPAPTANNEEPFTIPETWRWARLHTLGHLKGGGTPSKTVDEFWDGNIPWASPKDMKADILSDAKLHIGEAALQHSAASLIKAGSLLFVVRGMILAHSFPVAITKVPIAINQDMKALELKQPAAADYLLLALKGLRSQMLDKVERSTHGTCRIDGRAYREFMIPVPPSREQRRIVERTKDLLALCDGMEASLKAGNDARSRLLDSLLAEALAPARRGAA